MGDLCGRAYDSRTSVSIPCAVRPWSQARARSRFVGFFASGLE
jgi:hypothetical protein